VKRKPIAKTRASKKSDDGRNTHPTRKADRPKKLPTNNCGGINRQSRKDYGKKLLLSLPVDRYGCRFLRHGDHSNARNSSCEIN
jgi:hypothetical protein